MNRVTKRLGAVALALAGFFGVVEALAWANVFRERSKRAYLGNRLYLEIRGKGDPIVFLAGLQGSTRYWQPGFDRLAASHQLVYVDALGFGRSPWPLHEPTLDEHVEWLRRTLVAAGVTRNVTIVAHSFGTIVASRYAAQFPGEVSRLVLLGTPVFRGEAEARQRIQAMSQFAGLFSLNPVVAREACLMMGATRPLLQAVLPRLNGQLRSEVVQDAVLHDWPSINGAIQNVLLRSPIEPSLAGLKARIVFVQGDRDPVTSVARMAEVANGLHAELVVVPGDHQTYAGQAREVVIGIIERVLPAHGPPGPT